MYIIENVTPHPIRFARLVEIVEATDDPAKPKKYRRSGDVYAGEGIPAADVNAWELPPCLDPRAPSREKIRDEVYKELSAQPAFAAFLRAGDLRAYKEEK